MNTRRPAGPCTLAVLATTMFALAGCDNASPGAAPSASAGADQGTAIMDLAKCMRANGYPNFPDPVQDARGNWGLPESEDVPQKITVPACAELAKQAKQALSADEQVSAQDMAKLRQYTECMRENGMPDHLDPGSDGNFGVDDKTPTWRTGNEACKQYAPPQRPK